MPTTTTLIRNTTLALASLIAFAGCGTRAEIAYTYTKANVTEIQLLEDKAALKQTAGVVKVIGHLDSQNTARLELHIKEKGEETAVRKLLDLGYQQVRN